MAITVISTPDTMSISYRPMVYKWSSNVSDLQYCIVEVVDNDTGLRVSAKSVQLDLGSSVNFTVNISDIIQDNIKFTPFTLGAAGAISANKDSGVFEQIGLKVYEVTKNPSTGLIVTSYDPDDNNNSSFTKFIGGAGSQSSLVNGYNWTESHFNYNSFNITDFKLTGTTKKFLSKSPLIKDIELGVNEFIGVLYHEGIASKNFKLKILTYNSSDSLLNTDFIDITSWNSSYPYIPFNTFFTLTVGTQNLINLGVSLTNVSYYTIQVINDDGDKSELRRFNIAHVCSGDVRVHWANNYGKQDSYTFKGNKIETLNHKAKTYLKAIGNTYSSEKRGSTVMQNISNTSFEIFTDSISNNEYEFLANMLINKNAFIEDSGSYYPIIIEDGSKLIRNELNVPIQFKLVYRFANDTKGIRG